MADDKKFMIDPTIIGKNSGIPKGTISVNVPLDVYEQQKAYIEQLEQILYRIIEARNLLATVDTALARRIDKLTQSDEIMQAFSKWKGEEG